MRNGIRRTNAALGAAVAWAALVGSPMVPVAFAARSVAVKATFADPTAGSWGREYFVSAGATETQMIELRAALIEAGAAHVNFFVPDVIVCEPPAGLDRDGLLRGKRVRAVRELAIAPSSDLQTETAGDAARRLVWIRLCYDRALALSKRAVSHSPTPGGTSSAFNDVVVRIAPERVRRIDARQRAMAPGGVVERTLQQNSEFCGGDVLAQLVFPESNGEFEADTEQWTEQMAGNARSSAIAGLLAIEGSFPNMPLHFVFRTFERVPTGYEPIKHGMGSAGLWIRDTLLRIDPSLTSGNDAAAFDLVHEFNNKGRRQYGTDFVYTAFTASSENNPGHIFTGANYTAYAVLGGPYLVIPYPAGRDPEEIGNWLLYSQIFQHESGHIFWTLDEYIGAPGKCSDTSGYLNYGNGNLIVQGPGGLLHWCNPDGEVDCLMQHAARSDLGRPWCAFSQGQMGVVDANDNMIPDVYESEPLVRFATTGRETVETGDFGDNGFAVEFMAISTAVPNQNMQQADSLRVDYAAPLRAGRYRVAGLSENIFKPIDGKWNEIEENGAIRLASLPVGLSLIRVRVQNAAGYWSGEYTKRVYYIGLAYGLFDVTTGDEGINLKWSVIGPTFGATFDLYRLDTGQAMPGTRIAVDLQPLDGSTRELRNFAYRDAKVESGHTYRYYIQGSFTLQINGKPKDYEERSVILTKTAPLPFRRGNIVSVSAPNPFHDDVRVTVRVPASYTDADQSASTPGASRAPGAFIRRSATSLEVAVFDVLGRQVRVIHTGGEFRDLVPLVWDGRDSTGRLVPSGVYFIRARAGSLEGSRKVMLVR